MKILIVEDEMLIAETIKLYLQERDFSAVGIAISYDEAVQWIDSADIDLVLLDVRLYGSKSGIDIANYLVSHTGIPFVFLTSQYDKKILKNAMATNPGGYLTKPIQKETLWTTIALAYNNHLNNAIKRQRIVKFNDGINTIFLPENAIDYIESDHVYINIYTEDQKYVVRQSLQHFMENYLSSETFFKCHRSYIINLNKINFVGRNSVEINSHKVPISRVRRKEFQKIMQN